MRIGSEGQRRGVALITVLGLLSVLMLSAVAFAIFMRVERMGSYNMRHSLQARHMLWCSLARAMENLNRNLDPGTGAYEVYPPWDVLPSGQPGGEIARVLSDNAMEFVPGHNAKLMKSEPLTLKHLVLQQTSYWENISFATRVDNVREQQTPGRAAYLIVNASGLMDANYVGGKPRGSGAGPAEIQLNPNPAETFWDDVEDVEAFTNDRAKHIRYETLAELGYLNYGIADLSSPKDKIGDPTCFTVNSLSVEDEFIDTQGNRSPKAYIGEDTNLWDMTAIMNAFDASGIKDPKLKGRAWLNLQDYVDPDCIPKALDNACVEPVPMLNEFSFGYEIRFDSAGRINAGFGLLVEWYYPFLTLPTNRYDLVCDLTFISRVRHTAGPGAIPPGTTSVGASNITGSVLSVPLRPRAVPAFGLAAPGGVSPDNQINVNFVVLLKANIIDQETGLPVDEVPSPYGDRYGAPQGIYWEIDLRNISRGTSTTIMEWAECVDPRFNWNPLETAAPRQWVYGRELRAARPADNLQDTVPPKTETMNNTTRYSWLEAPVGKYDGDLQLFVRNGPLKSVGELGNICIEQMETIRLCDRGVAPLSLAAQKRNFHAVLDHFTLLPPGRPYAHGRVNVNTRSLDVLRSVFNGMPRREYDLTDTKPLDWRDDSEGVGATSIADTILSSNSTFRAMSELGRLNWEVLLGAGTEIEREAGLRNSSELLTVRQNLFTILLSAEAYSEGIGGSPGRALASIQGVAEVWRDPFPFIDSDDQRRHRCLVRTLQIIED